MLVGGTACGPEFTTLNLFNFTNQRASGGLDIEPQPTTSATNDADEDNVAWMFAVDPEDDAVEVGITSVEELARELCSFFSYEREQMMLVGCCCSGGGYCCCCSCCCCCLL